MLITYWNIILLKGHAYDLPYRPLLPFLWISLDLVIVLILSSLISHTLLRDLTIEIVDLSYTASALYFALWYYNKRPRFVQAYSALMGVGALFLSFLAIILIFVPVEMAIVITSQLIYFWMVVIFTRILKDALGISFFKAVLWVIGIEMARFLVITQVLQGFL